MDMAQVDGLDVPVDFPTSQFEAVQNTVVAYSGHNHHRLFLYALRAISHRFTAMAEYDTRLTASIRTHGTGPGQPFRYEQERDLFGFFSNGFSVFEAFCFALFAVGALTGSAEFPLATDADERRVEWNSMKQAYGRAFPGDPILSVLKTIANDTAFKKFRDDRGILTHRAVPPRTFNVTAGPSTVPESTTIERLNMPFDTETTRRDADTWQGF